MSRLLSFIAFLCLVLPTWSRDGWWSQVITPGLSSQVQVYHSATTIGGSLYASGTQTGYSSTQIYIPEINRWSTFMTNPNGFSPEDMDSVGGMLFSVGGSGGGSINSIYYVHVSNISSGWIQANQPAQLAARSEHTAVALGGSIFLFGGFGTQFYNQLYQFDTTVLFNNGQSVGWVLLNPNGASPTARKGHTAAVYGGSMYVFGGWSYNTAAGSNVNCSLSAYACTWYNDLWAFSQDTNTWTLVKPSGTLPLPRYGHSADVLGDRMLVFGGNNNNFLLNDLWSYSFARNVWEQLQPYGAVPGKRMDHSSAIVGLNLYIIGGSVNYHDDLWAFTLNVEQTYPASSSSANVDPATTAAVFNVFFLAVILGVTALSYRKIKSRRGHEYITDSNL